AIKHHERVWGDSSPLTAAQYRALDALCARAGIELVPNMNSLGHFDRWLRYEEYQPLAESKAPFVDPLGNTRPYPTTLCPDGRAVDFIASLYDDFLPNFTSKNFNVGCDEPWELGMGKSAEACKQKGKYKVYIDYLKKLENLCAVRGKTMHFWADVLLENPEYSKELSPGTVAVLWGYYPDSPIDEEAKTLQELGRKFIIAGGTNTWNSFALRLNAAYQNVKDVCSAAKNRGALGAILTNWGDNGNHQAWCAMWLPVIAFAQSAWGETFDEADVCRAADSFVFRDATSNMSKAVTLLGRADPSVKLHSLHNKLFFGKPAEVEALKAEGVSKKHFDQIYNGAEAAIEAVKKADPHCPDAEVCKGELLLAADLMKWSVARACDDVNVESARLRKGLKIMKGQYEQLWLARARIGGLFESSARAFLNRSPK
ncbi:MAG: family 20 glycosylhydrolase, partial [Opitutales bacterium]|nr:family 20 glycosylhydrolase [Opitutales bacterium]